MKPTALQLCEFSPYLEHQVAALFNVVRWFELSAARREEFLASHAREVEAIVTGGHIGCPSPLIERLPRLGVVAINGVGYDKVDLALARSRNVRVTVTPGVLTDDVADLAVGLIISLLRRIPAAEQHLRHGAWEREGEMPIARKVTGSRFGIVGFGQIGAAIARRLDAFGEIAYTDPHRKDVPYKCHASLRELAEWADVLVIASSANASTHRLIDKEVLNAIGSEGYLVNVARGSVVDEQALIEALEQGVIAGAALDVFDNEPKVPAALLDQGETVLTPHIASATGETRRAMADVVIANLKAYRESVDLPSAVV